MSGGGKVSQGYQPTGQAQADQQLQGYQNQIGQGANQLISTSVPAAYTLYNTTAQNSYAPGYVTGAANAGQAATGVGQQALQGSQGLAGLGQSLQSLAPGIMQSGFDPQNANYNRQLQSLEDKQNAINSMYGVASSPYGAGVAGQAVSNFNMDWQAQEQQRQAQAVNALATLGQSATGLGQGAQSLGQSGYQDVAQGGYLPYGAQQQVGNDQWSQLQNLIQSITGSYGLSAQGAGLDTSYLQTGQSATGLQQNAQKQNIANSNQSMQNWGTTLANLAMMMG